MPGERHSQRRLSMVLFNVAMRFFLVHPQGLVGKPKASVIESRASLLAKGERQPGVTGFATLLRGCNYVAKVPYVHKKTTAYAVAFFGASSGTRTLDPLIKSPKRHLKKSTKQ